MGDDGVAWHLVERLRSDPRLPPDVEIAWGGTDLLACAGLLEGRERVVLLDAVEGDVPGEVVQLDPRSEGLEERSTGAHALAVPEALRLLQHALPDLATTEILLLGVTVTEVRMGERLSPTLEERLPRIVARVLAGIPSSVSS
jgi:hydrogenase maturation protease